MRLPLKLSFRLPKKLLLLSLCVLLAISAVSFVCIHWDLLSRNQPQPKTYTIVRTSKGFEPDIITINKGDSITFTTNRKVPFWPASSLHPTHTIYPEFDPKEPIYPPDTWTFKFNRVGSWSFHDHIAATFTGVIHVIDPLEKDAKEKNYLDIDCTTLTGNERTQCWDLHFKNVVETQGQDVGFDYFISIYKMDSDVEKGCHEWAHSLGEAGYEVFKNGGTFKLRPETAWCSYGYFHGFMNAMIADTGNLDKVVDFCAMATKQLKDELPQIESNCLHGIGHVGVDILFEQPEYWGNYEKTANAAFALCDKLFGNNQYINECYGGVIHGLRFNMRNEQNGMSFGDMYTTKDPYVYCRNLQTKYLFACYSDFATMFWEVFNGNFSDAMHYILNEHIKDPHTLDYTLAKLATGWVEHDLPTNNHKPTVEACRTLTYEQFYSCFQGISIGFIQHGEPNNLEGKAYEFCRVDYLTADEKKLCFAQFLGALAWNYSPDQMIHACAELQPEERSYSDTCLKATMKTATSSPQ